MKYAHISNGIVDSIVGNDPYKLFNPAYAGEFVEAPDAVETGWLFDGATFTPPPPPSFDEVKRRVLDDINRAFEQAMNALVAGYPEREISSWPQQEKEARAYIANNAAATPLLDALSAARGVTKGVLAQKIVQKSAQYAAAAGALIGKRQALEDKINAATTLTELQAITW